MAQPFVSIVILNYNGLDYTKKSIASIKKIDYSKKNYEILVVENGSAPHEFDELKKIKGIRLVQIPKNVGFSGGHNVGMKHARGPYVMMLNNDVTVSPNILKQMVPMIHNKKNVGVVGPVIKNKGKFYQKLTFTRMLGTLFFYMVHQPNPQEQKSFAVSGVCMLVRKKDFPEPFPPIYYSYHEDSYLMVRCRFLGMEPVLCSTTSLDHVGGATRYQNWGLYAFHEEKNKLLNFFTLYEKTTILKLLPLLIVDELFILLLSLVRGGFLARAKAFPWVLTHIPEVRSLRRKAQKGRKISDRQLFRYMTYRSHYTPPWLGKIVSTAQQLYCFVFRIPVYEFSK